MRNILKEADKNPDFYPLKDLKYWLRWCTIIPGALIASVLSTFLLHWILYSTLSNFIEPYPELPERLLTPFICAVTFIWVGSRIAPAHRDKTSLILFGLWMLGLGGVVLFTLTGTLIGSYHLYFHGGCIAPIMAIIGALVGLYVVRRSI